MSREDPAAVEAPCCGSTSKVDKVAEAGMESFPASDPPAWTTGQDAKPASPKSGCCASDPPSRG